jgi:hypothetical protein
MGRQTRCHLGHRPRRPYSHFPPLFHVLTCYLWAQPSTSPLHPLHPQQDPLFRLKNLPDLPCDSWQLAHHDLVPRKVRCSALEEAEPGIAVAVAADVDCVYSNWVHQSAAAWLVEDAGAVCVAGGDVVVEDAAGVVAGAVHVAGNTAVGPAVPVDEDTRAESSAEELQG